MVPERAVRLQRRVRRRGNAVLESTIGRPNWCDDAPGRWKSTRALASVARRGPVAVRRRRADGDVTPTYFPTYFRPCGKLCRIAGDVQRLRPLRRDWWPEDCRPDQLVGNRRF